jgi:hypothetical protein
MEVLMMEREMGSWNDDRLDELNRRVDEGFAKVDKRFEQVDKRFEQVDKRFEQVASREDLAEMKLASREEIGEVKAELRHLNERFDRLYYTLLVVMIGLVGSLFAKGGF